MDTLTVVGDGAVGTAAAVALSISHRVILAGPPGVSSHERKLSVSGHGEAAVLYTGIDRIKDSALVVAALKAFDISAASPFISRFFNGKVICLSNGMGLDEEWGSLAESVEYAVLTAGFKKTDTFSVSHTPGSIYCLRNGQAEKVFQGTFLKTQVSDDMEHIRWAKWYANSIINPLGALTGQPNNEIRGSDLGEMIEPLEEELRQIMPSFSSISLGREMLNWLLENSSNSCSMLHDVRAGRKTEINFLTGYGLSSSNAERPLCSSIVNQIKKLS